MRAWRQIASRNARRGGLLQEWVSGQAEDALTDLVALDLPRTTGDGHGAVHEVERVAHHRLAVHERGVRAAELGEDGGRLVTELVEDELGDGALRSGLRTGDGATRAAQGEQCHR